METRNKWGTGRGGPVWRPSVRGALSRCQEVEARRRQAPRALPKESFVALNLVLKPMIDELFMKASFMFRNSSARTRRPSHLRSFSPAGDEGGTPLRIERSDDEFLWSQQNFS
jgi:hypothetical protein